MKKTTDKLFVYGSLLGEIQSNIARFLRNNNRFIGVFQIQGQLYDLGCYPGLVVLPDHSQWVRGHVYQLNNIAATLSVLDDYEGITPGQEESGLYRRQMIKIYQQHHSEMAWAYIYNGTVENLPVIPFNDYLEYLKISDAHQQFIQSV